MCQSEVPLYILILLVFYCVFVVLLLFLYITFNLDHLLGFLYLFLGQFVFILYTFISFISFSPCLHLFSIYLSRLESTLVQLLLFFKCAIQINDLRMYQYIPCCEITHMQSHKGCGQQLRFHFHISVDTQMLSFSYFIRYYSLKNFTTSNSSKKCNQQK